MKTWSGTFCHSDYSTYKEPVKKQLNSENWHLKTIKKCPL